MSEENVDVFEDSPNKKTANKLIAEKMKDFKTFVQLIVNMISHTSKIRKDLKDHINEPSIEIMIMGRGGSWEEWTGNFYYDNTRKIEALKKKTEEHFNFYFAKNNPGKEFAFVLKVDGETEIYKKIKT